MIDSTKWRFISFLLGILYVVFIGFFGGVGIHAQATLFHVTYFLIFLFLARSQRLSLSRYHKIIVVVGLALSLFFAITTNSWMVGITYPIVWFLMSFLQVSLFEKRTPNGIVQYIQSLIRYCGYAIVNLLSIGHVKQFFAIRQHNSTFHVKKETVYGLLIALPLLAVFHALFVRVNADYSVFMANILEQIWHVIRTILDIEFLWILLKGAIQGYIFYILLSMEHTKKQDVLLKKNLPIVIMKIVFASLISLFFIFMTFQSKLLLLDIFHLAFKQVSQYIQKGFIELLFVSLIGYLLSITALHGLVKESAKDRKHMQLLLTIFSLELTAITVFLFHKLYALQAVFGFKDERILATGAILLIFTTFILLIYRIWGKITSTQVFHWQILLCAGLVLVFHVGNIDLFVSRYNSIRYTVGEKQYKDYSYLLGNSYDNVSEWERLMKEAKEIGIPLPDETYYWGHNSSSQKDFYGGSYSPICEKKVIFPNLLDDQGRIMQDRSANITYSYVSYLGNRYTELQAKYDHLSIRSPLKNIAEINLREYQAYLFMKNHKEMMESFIEFAKQRCVAS